jgi:uncharacterized membrane protein YgaE (UPF0421/DUF939 family)
MIDTILFIIIVTLFLTIIGYVIYSITNNKSLKDNNQVDEVLKDCDNKLNRLLNPKLQQVIEEANLEKTKIENEKRLNVKLAIEKEKQRLLKDDFIYKLIRQSIVNGDWRLRLQDNYYDDEYQTLLAINSIPGLKAEAIRNGKFISVKYK